MHVLIAIEESNFPVRCPEFGCEHQLDICELSLLLTEEELGNFYRFSLKSYLATHLGELVGCPTPGCDNFVYKTESDLAIIHFCCV